MEAKAKSTSLSSLEAHPTQCAGLSPTREENSRRHTRAGIPYRDDRSSALATVFLVSSGGHWRSFERRPSRTLKWTRRSNEIGTSSSFDLYGAVARKGGRA